MKTIKIEETKNGYIVDVAGFIKSHGRYVYRSLDLVQMIQFVGELVIDSKVDVIEK